VSLTDRQYFAMAVLLYGISMIYSVFLWRKGFRQDNRVNYVLLLCGFVLHTVAMAKRGFSLERCPVNNLYEATTFIAWTIVTTYLVLGLFTRLRFLGAFASPVLFAVGVFALMPALDVHGPKPEFSGGLLSLHAALTLLAYGAFGLSSIAAFMYLTQEHDLKFHKMRAIISLMPPIQRLELVSSRLLFAGFVLLTGGLAVGAVYLNQRNAGLAYYRSDPKIMWSVAVWIIYLGLLIGHWRNAPSGRRFAWGIIASFVFVLLTFWGINLLSPIHNP